MKKKKQIKFDLEQAELDRKIFEAQEMDMLEQFVQKCEREMLEKLKKLYDKHVDSLQEQTHYMSCSKDVWLMMIDKGICDWVTKDELLEADKREDGLIKQVEGTRYYIRKGLDE